MRIQFASLKTIRARRCESPEISRVPPRAPIAPAACAGSRDATACFAARSETAASRDEARAERIERGVSKRVFYGLMVNVAGLLHGSASPSTNACACHAP